jgi:DNA-binding NarL/FixJ family response regulator
VVLLDLTMPGPGGLETIKQIKELKPALPVLVLSVHSEQQYAVRALKAGASGYLTKECAPDELVRALRRVVEGGRYLSQDVAELLAREVASNERGTPHKRLSDREFQVLRKLAGGRSVKEIAQELALSEKTISTYRRRILDKMGMRSNAELIRYAVQEGLIDE